MSDLLHCVAFHPSHVPALYQLYRTQTDHLPHNLVLSLERFQAALLGYPHDRLLVAEVHGVAHGFAALSHVQDDRGTTSDAIVALFANQPATTLLIKECVARTAPRPLLAFPRTHGQCPIPAYNAGWDGLSDLLPATAEALVAHGFVPYYREWMMSCDLAHWARSHAAMQVAHTEGITLTNEINQQGEYIQRALAADTEVGVCVYTTLATRADDPRAAAIGYIEWLWVAEHYRRRGIARELLARSMQRLVSLGCQLCWLTTGAENWAAQPLYQAYGFETVDITTSFSKD